MRVSSVLILSIFLHLGAAIPFPSDQSANIQSQGVPVESPTEVIPTSQAPGAGSTHQSEAAVLQQTPAQDRITPTLFLLKKKALLLKKLWLLKPKFVPIPIIKPPIIIPFPIPIPKPQPVPVPQYEEPDYQPSYPPPPVYYQAPPPPIYQAPPPPPPPVYNYNEPQQQYSPPAPAYNEPAPYNPPSYEPQAQYSEDCVQLPQPQQQYGPPGGY